MIKMVLTDGDGTLWSYDNEPFRSSWDALPDSFSKELREKWFFARDSFFKKPEYSYTDWFKEQLGMLKGLSLAEVEKVLFPVPYSPGARKFFSSLGENGFKSGIVSSGVSLVADRAKEELGIDFAFSNILNVEKGIFTGEGEMVIDLESKGDFVKRLARENKVRLSEVCFIGDDLNDLPVLEVVGHPFVFNPKSEALNRFTEIKNFEELNDILKAQNGNGQIFRDI